MLQLLLERGQSYSDLAGVLGVDEAEVRTRARAALTELAGADPDRNVGLTDFLLGQADPIGRADAVRHLRDDPEDLGLATELSQKLRLVAPEAELPRLPGEERRPRPRRAPRLPLSRLPIPDRLRRRGRPAEPAAPGAPGGEPAVPRTTLSRRQTQLLVALGSGAVLLVAIILGVTGAFGGGSDGGGTATTATNPNAGEELTRVKLQAQNGGGASGTAIFGLASGQPYVDITLDGLKPATSNQTYVIWLLLTPDQGYPLSPISISQSGSYHDRFPIPSAVVPVVARVQYVDISLAPRKTVASAIQTAIKKKNIVITRPGTSLLRGTIPKAANTTGQS
jgi:hypothetical protein